MVLSVMLLGISAAISATPWVEHALSSADFAEGPPPAGISIGRADAVGPIYVAENGMTLYTNDLDVPGGAFGCANTRYEKTGGADGYPLPRAAHRRTCLEKWTPFTAAAGAAGRGPWSVVTRPDGQRQWAYDGHPLYLSRRDQKPGDVTGTMGFARYGAWRLAAVPLRLPPGAKLLRKVDGLMLAAADDGKLLLSVRDARPASEAGLTPMVAPELAADDQVIVRRDGRKQWAYRGIALYRPSPDSSASLIQSRVKTGDWRPLLVQRAQSRPKFLSLHMSVPEIGWVFGDASGRTLYAMYCLDQVPDRLSCDEVGDPAAHWSALCGDAAACAKEWRPVRAAESDRPSGAWGIAEVPYPQFKDPTGAYGEGVPTVRAWTYHGRPVYTFSGDESPGDVQGHGIEAKVSGFGAITVLGEEFPAMP